MKKTLSRICFLTILLTLVVLSGCREIQDSANAIRKEGETAINQASQQAENIKNQVIQTKQTIDKKSQQVVNAVDALNKLGQ